MDTAPNTQNPTSETGQPEKKKKGKPVLFFAGGVLVGIVLCAIIGWMSMPGMMLVIHESRFDTIEETCQKLKSAIEANGWSSPAIRNMNKSMEKHGVHMNEQFRIVELCKAGYAKDILSTNPEVTTLMPCAWGVYKGEDGTVYISGMNMGLMGKMFGGNIAEVMGTSVSKDEKQILKNIVKQ